MASPALPCPALSSTGPVFVYDDACGPCTHAAELLVRRAAGAATGAEEGSAGSPQHLRVVPFSAVRDSLSADQRERFAREALFLEAGSTREEGRERWGAEAVAAALRQSPHRADRLVGQVLSTGPVRPAAHWVYARVSAHRWVLRPALRILDRALGGSTP